MNVKIKITKAPDLYAHLVGKEMTLDGTKGHRGTGTLKATGDGVQIYVGSDSGFEYKELK